MANVYRCWAALGLWLVACLCPVWAGQPVTTVADEMHLLIDVSGSMKQNDPENLRVDAAKLWLNLLPEGHRVAVWLFAENTRLLQQSDHVDAAWKQQAISASSKIDARGRHTDIEGAIKTLLDKGFNAEGQRHLMLLTDGRVDTSSDIMVSADSRERILSDWIPQLKQRHIQVHTLALSDQADAALLQALASETGGWSEHAESAEQLQRLFLKMLQQAAPRDQLPLTDNRFKVDASVKEFSVVVFKAPKAPATRLIAPNQQVIDRQSSATSWLETGGYDSITVKQPQTGKWRIDAASDPDNQVMILTDLKLELEPLPHHIDAQQALTLKAHLSEQNQVITREDFLGLVQWALSVDQQAPAPLLAVQGEPGFFTQSLTSLSPGKHTLTLRADGKTFQREQIREVDVHETPLLVDTSEAQSPQIDLPSLAIDENHSGPAAEHTPEVEQITSAHHVSESTASVDETTPWGQVMAMVLGVNVLVAIAGWWAYRVMQRSNQAKQQQLLERLG